MNQISADIMEQLFHLDLAFKYLVTITLVQPTEAGIVLASSAELNCEADVLAIVKWPPNCFVGTSTQGNPVTCIATVCGIRV